MVKKLKLKLVLDNSWFILIVALIISAPLIFWNAIHQSPPMGYAGMFALMAEQIGNFGFKLPIVVPYYGPGGVPFAYPPLGLYLLAVLIKILGKTLTILRFFPPLFSLLSLIPLYFLTIEISDLKLAGFFTVILASASPELNIPHAWAAGIVRAPAFGFILLALLFHLRCTHEFRWRDILWGGVFFGATILTHLSYALFAALWIFVWTLLNLRWRNLVIASAVALIGALVAFPWITLMFSRYGTMIFVNALDSHGNGNFISVLTNFEGILLRLQTNLKDVLGSYLLTSLIFLGVFFEIIKKRIALMLIFLSSAFFLSDGERFVYTMGFLLAGIGFGNAIYFLLKRTIVRVPYLTISSVAFFALWILVYFWNDGLARINNYYPQLDSPTLDLGEYFQQSTPLNSIYLALVPQDEAEWMPYLFSREPLVAQWGSEWLGTYNQQVLQMIKTRACKDKQDLDCLRQFFVEIGKEPDYLVILQNDKKLIKMVWNDSDWEFTYQNPRYIVWHNMGQ